MGRWLGKIVALFVAVGLLTPLRLSAQTQPVSQDGAALATASTTPAIAVGKRIQDLLNANVRLSRDRKAIYWSPQTTSTSASSDSGRQLVMDQSSLGGLGELADLQQLSTLNTLVLKMKTDREEDLLKVLEVVSALDQPKKQVLVQVIVAEYQRSTNRSLKNQALGKGTDFFPGMNLSSLFAFDHSTSSLAEQERINTGFELFLIEGRRLEAFLAVQKTDSRFRVVSEPRVVVNHGEVAQVFVGKGYNLVNAETTVSGQKAITTFQPANIGLAIAVTPYLYSDGRIGLKLDESFSDLLEFNRDAARKQTQRSNRELHFGEVRRRPEHR